MTVYVLYIIDDMRKRYYVKKQKFNNLDEAMIAQDKYSNLLIDAFENNYQVIKISDRPQYSRTYQKKKFFR